MCTGSLSRELSGRGVAFTTHPPSSAEVKERVEQYVYSPSGHSRPVPGWILPLPFTVGMLGYKFVQWKTGCMMLVWTDQVAYSQKTFGFPGLQSARIRQRLWPATSIFLGLPLSLCKWWDGSQAPSLHCVFSYSRPVLNLPNWYPTSCRGHSVVFTSDSH